MNERLPSIIAVSSIFYVFRPRSIETGCQRLSSLVANAEGLTLEPQLRRLPVTQTGPYGQPPLAHRRARDSSRGRGEKSAFKIPSMCEPGGSPYINTTRLSLPTSWPGTPNAPRLLRASRERESCLPRPGRRLFIAHSRLLYERA